MCAAIRTILQGGCCAGVSDGGGFCPGQAGVGNIAESQLGHDAPPVAGHTQPSLEPLRCCFPERAEVPSSDMACRRRCHCEGVWARSTGAALVTSIGGACHDEGWVGLRTRRRPRQRARARARLRGCAPTYASATAPMKLRCVRVCWCNSVVAGRALALWC